MDFSINHLGQPVGIPVFDWHRPSPPARAPLHGQYCRIEPIEPSCHADSLFESCSLDTEGRLWTYLPYGPFDNLEAYRSWTEEASRTPDPMYFAILEASTSRAIGTAAYLRIDPENGSIEVGGLCYSPFLQRTRMATEAMFLMMEYAFLQGFRRYEWKCNALNAASRAAAERLGFSFEGIFRQATVVKGRNRDTAWYSVVDREWPDLKKRFLEWLDPSNFDSCGQQKNRFSVEKNGSF